MDGQWIAADNGRAISIANPATGESLGQAVLGSRADADRAIAAAVAAFPRFSATTRDARKAMLTRLLAAHAAAAADLEDALIREVGMPRRVAQGQTEMSRAHIETAIEQLDLFRFESAPAPGVTILREPVGVCAMITSWNNPISQILCKVAPAIAAGCTSVVKPSEIAPLIGLGVAQMFAEADLPPGVFNLVNGDAEVGERLASHPDVAMISFTGSLAGGAAVARAGAATIKRVHQELGGKSPNIVLPDADFAVAIPASVALCFMNNGQTCAAPSRLLVPANRFDEAARLAVEAAERMTIGSPDLAETDLGPLVSERQWQRVNAYVQHAIDDGAPLLTGGVGKPDNLPDAFRAGHFARPTIFGPVDRNAQIAREEIFGPALVIQTYRDEDDAVAIANDTCFGLAGYVQSADAEHARRVAARLRAGHVSVNFPRWNRNAPFGGYQQSGNGRQFGVWGFEEFLETKALVTP